MMSDELLEKLAKKCSDKTQKLYLRLHKAILSVSPRNINYDIYPIYITYNNIKTDKVFVIIYLNKDFLDLGFSLTNDQKLKGEKSAKHMKYPGITKFVRISLLKEINLSLRTAFKMSYMGMAEMSLPKGVR